VIQKSAVVQLADVVEDDFDELLAGGETCGTVCQPLQRPSPLPWAVGVDSRRYLGEWEAVVI
jgi:hypothetical protein